MKMKVFKDYADFYDSLYEDKNYQEECNFVKHVFETYSEKKVNSILDLGCGTGSHVLKSWGPEKTDYICAAGY
jgi:predicted TPR repeat methyltransferase